MKRFVAIIAFFLLVPNVYAHSSNVKGYKEKDSNYISKCNNKYYGYHKNKGKNHWHEVKYKKDKWDIVDSDKTFEKNPCSSSEKKQAVFVNCVDGDTAVLKVDQKELRYRFLGVDTPESVHPTKEVEVYAKEASKNTCDLLTNASSIVVEYDSNSDQTDKYGRELAWIWVDEILLQELMVSEGFARVAYVYGDYKYIDSLCSLQHQAIINNKGIWQYGYEVGYCETHDNNVKESNPNNIYKVKFDNDGEIEEVAVAEGMKVKYKSVESKIGYRFVGWYHNGKKFDFNTPIDSSITLIAKYSIDYIYVLLLLIVLIIGILNNIKGDKSGKSHKKSTKYNRTKRI